MMEEEWLASEDPQQMLEFIRNRASDRKLRLLSCAIIRSAPISDDGRTMWELVRSFDWFEQKAWRYESGKGGEVVQTQDLVTISCHDAIEIAERSVEATGMGPELASAAFGTFAARYSAEADTFGHDPAVLPGSEYHYRIAQCFDHATAPSDNLVQRTVPILDYLDRFGQLGQPVVPGFVLAVASVIRDIFGNPFRPGSFSPAWRTDTALSLARQMYESCDFGAMPILADALQEVGCDGADVLDHCRGEGPHVRGCWVVDLVLGKE